MSNDPKIDDLIPLAETTSKYVIVYGDGPDSVLPREEALKRYEHDTSTLALEVNDEP